MGELVKKVSDRISTPKNAIHINISKLKPHISPAARVTNWNELQNLLKLIDIQIENSTKALIISGGVELIAAIINQLYKLYQNFVLKSNDDQVMYYSVKTLIKKKKYIYIEQYLFQKIYILYYNRVCNLRVTNHKL